MIRTNPKENGIARVIAELIKSHGDEGRRVAHAFVAAIGYYIASRISANISDRDRLSPEEGMTRLRAATERVTRLRPELASSSIILAIEGILNAKSDRSTVTILQTDYIALSCGQRVA